MEYLENMVYTSDFKDLIQKSCNSQNKYLKFIGLGNPTADILIIGKEEYSEEEEGSLEGGILSQHNAILWERNYKNNTAPKDIDNWKIAEGKYANERFNPLVPYKEDQKFKIFKKLKNNKSGFKDNGGTSSTWKNYQKFLGYFYDDCQIESEEQINFHQYAFISELSSIPFKRSPKGINKDVRDSILIRCKNLFSHPFFSHFKIVIVACGDYISKYDDKDKKLLYNTFKIPYIKEEKIGTHSIYIHKSDNRVLIQCRQFSNRISNDFIKILADRCKEYVAL